MVFVLDGKLALGLSASIVLESMVLMFSVRIIMAEEGPEHVDKSAYLNFRTNPQPHEDLFAISE